MLAEALRRIAEAVQERGRTSRGLANIGAGVPQGHFYVARERQEIEDGARQVENTFEIGLAQHSILQNGA